MTIVGLMVAGCPIAAINADERALAEDARHWAVQSMLDACSLGRLFDGTWQTKNTGLTSIEVDVAEILCLFHWLSDKAGGAHEFFELVAF
jgi:hypothetical protein